jgi:ATP-binding cassette subfamily F protein 3
LLGRFLFSGEDAEKPLAGLSGGERRRLSLAVLVSGGANVLILDEPTNHLDLESREALEDALLAFQGALILVSHDRALLDAVGTRTVALEDRRLHSYTGGWPEYVRVREERRLAGGERAAAPAAAPRAPAPTPRAVKESPAKQRSAKPSAAAATSKNRQQQQTRATQAVEDAEAALSALELELSDPAAWATKYESAKSQARHTAATRAVEAAYAQLEALL